MTPNPLSFATGDAPVVSVVIPAYNASRTLPTAIASVASQTFTDLELVVVDDGSTDNTAEVAGACGVSNVRVVRQANAGHAAARNTGIDAARGRYLAFLDADDLWLPTKLSRQLNLIDRNPGIRAVQTGAAIVDDDLRLLWREPCTASRDCLWDTLCLKNMPALMSTLLVDRALIREVGAFDSSLVILQDWDLAIRLAATDGFAAIPDVLAAYRRHDGNQSGNVEIHVEPGYRILDRMRSDPRLSDLTPRQWEKINARFCAMLSGGELRNGRPWKAVAWGVKAMRHDPTVSLRITSVPVRRWRRRRERSAGGDLGWSMAVIDANNTRTMASSKTARSHRADDAKR